MTTKGDSFGKENLIELSKGHSKQGYNKLIVGFVVLNVLALTGMGFAMISFHKELTQSRTPNTGITSMYMWAKEEQAIKA